MDTNTHVAEARPKKPTKKSELSGAAPLKEADDLSLPDFLRRSKNAATAEPVPPIIIGGAAPLKEPDDATVALGQEAWKQLKANTRKSWGHWLKVGTALLVGKKECLKKAGIEDVGRRCNGRRFNEEFSHWMDANGFGEIDDSDRSKLISIMENLDEIEEWRVTLTEGQRASWNSPSTVWRVAHCKDRGLLRLRSEQPDSNGSDIQHDEEDEHRAEHEDKHGAEDEHDDKRETEIRWQDGLTLRVRKAIGDAKLHDHWLLPAPPELGLIALCREAAAEWTALADYLEAVVDGRAFHELYQGDTLGRPAIKAEPVRRREQTPS